MGSGIKNGRSHPGCLSLSGRSWVGHIQVTWMPKSDDPVSGIINRMLMAHTLESSHVILLSLVPWLIQGFVLGMKGCAFQKIILGQLGDMQTLLES